VCVCVKCGREFVGDARNIDSKDFEIAARELHKHLGGEVRGNYTTFDG